MSKVALIRQPAGLGDIMWLQPIVNHIASRGFEVLYPVCDHYYDRLIGQLETDNSKFIRESDLSGKMKDVYLQTQEIIEDDFEYYPFDCISDPSSESFRPEYSHVGIMERKYHFYKFLQDDFDISDNDWPNCCSIKRDYDRESELKKNFGSPEKYIFVNNFFGTPPGVIKRKIETRKDLEVVYNNESVENMFDFCGLLEGASEIHTVETSFCYLVELIDTNATLHLYSRQMPDGINQHGDFSYINKVYKKDWEKHL
jgi:hypothetical protein